MNNILITGGLGFIGLNMAKLVSQNPNYKNIVIVDKESEISTPHSLELIGHNITYIKGNINDTSLIGKILLKYEINHVVNYAANSSVDACMERPAEITEDNYIGTINLLNSCYEYITNNKIDDFRYIQVSTDEVYGSLNCSHNKFTEDNPYKPTSPYSISKTAADLYVQYFAETKKFPAVITNCGNNYGPFQYPEKLIPTVIKNALTKNVINIYGSGLNVRDWIFVDDHNNAILTILTSEKSLIHYRKYNIGANCEKKNIEIVDEICDMVNMLHYDNKFDCKTLIRYGKDRPGHDFRYAINSERIERLGWKTKNTFTMNLLYTVNWYLKHQDWLDKCKLKAKVY